MHAVYAVAEKEKERERERKRVGGYINTKSLKWRVRGIRRVR